MYNAILISLGSKEDNSWWYKMKKIPNDIKFLKTPNENECKELTLYNIIQTQGMHFRDII